MKLINNIIGLTLKVVSAILLISVIVVLGIVAAGLVSYDYIKDIKNK